MYVCVLSYMFVLTYPSSWLVLVALQAKRHILARESKKYFF